jgi:hypothetical protein
MPTILDLVGFDAPSDTSGIALGPMLRGDSSLPDRLVYCDEGFDLSAYGPEGFIRVGGIVAAWGPEEGKKPARMAPRWAQYLWASGKDWQFVDSIEGSSKETIRSYFRQAVPMVKIEESSESRNKMLRALGYGE